MSLEKPQLNKDKKPALSCRLLSLAELCRELSVSVATGRNWVKTGKIKPIEIKDNSPFFDLEYVEKLKESIKNGENGALKKRRNKKYVSGNGIYNSYISNDSVNILRVEKLIEAIRKNGIVVTDSVISALTADCAVQMIAKKNGCNGTLEGYLSGDRELFGLRFLIDDLLTGEEKRLFEEYPDVFEIEYEYEASCDVLGYIYMSLKNMANRKATGAYYTPTRVVKKLIAEVFLKKENKVVADPCCGTGNFLLNLPDDYDFKYVFGNDIDSMSVKLCRINVALKFNVTDKALICNHITVSDFIFGHRDTKYDVIIGNPPWGYDFSDSEKKILKERYVVASGFSVDSYEVFIERAISQLNYGGILAFVLPESFLNVKAHAPVRKLLVKDCAVSSLEYLGEIFHGVQCPSIIIKLIKTGKPFDGTGTKVEKCGDIYFVNTTRNVSDGDFTFSVTDEEYMILKKIENLPGAVTLKGRADFALGIVTGDNKRYISDIKTKENERVVAGSDLEPFKIKYADRFITFNGNAFQQLAPLKYYRAKEKLIYRFISDSLVFAYDNEGLLSLNSANILIPHIDGLDIKYIMAVLNSCVAQFYFKKSFGSVKVLRSHLEKIPIPIAGEKLQVKIIEMVERIIKCDDEKMISGLREELDGIVSALYGLSEEEQERIRGLVQ